MKPLNAYSISYYVRRLIPADEDKGIKEHKSNPSPEKSIGVAAESQDAAVAHAKTIINKQELGGVKESANREITVTSVNQGVKMLHVHVAPPAVVIEDGTSVFTQAQVDEKVAEAKKGFFNEAEVNAKIAEALRAEPAKPAAK